METGLALKGGTALRGMRADDYAGLQTGHEWECIV